MKLYTLSHDADCAGVHCKCFIGSTYCSFLATEHTSLPALAAPYTDSLSLLPFHMRAFAYKNPNTGPSLASPFLKG